MNFIGLAAFAAEPSRLVCLTLEGQNPINNGLILKIQYDGSSQGYGVFESVRMWRGHIQDKDYVLAVIGEVTVDSKIQNTDGSITFKSFQGLNLTVLPDQNGKLTGIADFQIGEVTIHAPVHSTVFSNGVGCQLSDKDS